MECSFENYQDYPELHEIVFKRLSDNLETDKGGALLIDDKEGKEQGDDDGKVYQCLACRKIFTEYAELKEHVHQVRKNKKNTTHPFKISSFKCMECEKVFSKMNKFREHVIGHTGIRDYECPDCSKQFLRKSNLNQHMKIHLEVKPVTCNVCWKRFARVDQYKSHYLTHTGEKRFECPTCHQYFGLLSSLKRHISSIHSDKMNFSCSLCPGGRKFKTNSNLAAHMRTHSGVKQHKCFKCDEKFLRKSDLTRHQNIHLEIKPHACKFPQCKESFLRKSGLDRHIHKVHTGERPYKCKVCGRGYISNDVLRRHIKKQGGKCAMEPNIESH